MPRLLGVDIPGNKSLPYALRYIYGIGPKIADDVIAAAEMDSGRRAHDLSEEEINKIAGIIADKNLKVEGDLRRDIMVNLMCYIYDKLYRRRYLVNQPIVIHN